MATQTCYKTVHFFRQGISVKSCTELIVFLFFFQNSGTSTVILSKIIPLESKPILKKLDADQPVKKSEQQREGLSGSSQDFLERENSRNIDGGITAFGLEDLKEDTEKKLNLPSLKISIGNEQNNSKFMEFQSIPETLNLNSEKNANLEKYETDTSKILTMDPNITPLSFNLTQGHNHPLVFNVSSKHNKHLHEGTLESSQGFLKIENVEKIPANSVKDLTVNLNKIFSPQSLKTSNKNETNSYKVKEIQSLPEILNLNEEKDISLEIFEKVVATEPKRTHSSSNMMKENNHSLFIDAFTEDKRQLHEDLSERSKSLSNRVKTPSAASDIVVIPLKDLKVEKNFIGKFLKLSNKSEAISSKVTELMNIPKGLDFNQEDYENTESFETATLKEVVTEPKIAEHSSNLMRGNDHQLSSNATNDEKELQQGLPENYLSFLTNEDVQNTNQGITSLLLKKLDTNFARTFNMTNTKVSNKREPIIEKIQNIPDISNFKSGKDENLEAIEFGAFKTKIKESEKNLSPPDLVNLSNYGATTNTNNNRNNDLYDGLIEISKDFVEKEKTENSNDDNRMFSQIVESYDPEIQQVESYSNFRGNNSETLHKNEQKHSKSKQMQNKLEILNLNPGKGINTEAFATNVLKKIVIDPKVTLVSKNIEKESNQPLLSNATSDNKKQLNNSLSGNSRSSLEREEEENADDDVTKQPHKERKSVCSQNLQNFNKDESINSDVKKGQNTPEILNFNSEKEKSCEIFENQMLKKADIDPKKTLLLPGLVNGDNHPPSFNATNRHNKDLHANLLENKEDFMEIEKDQHMDEKPAVLRLRDPKNDSDTISNRQSLERPNKSEDTEVLNLTNILSRNSEKDVDFGATNKQNGSKDLSSRSIGNAKIKIQSINNESITKIMLKSPVNQQNDTTDFKRIETISSANADLHLKKNQVKTEGNLESNNSKFHPQTNEGLLTMALFSQKKLDEQLSIVQNSTAKNGISNLKRTYNTTTNFVNSKRNTTDLQIEKEVALFFKTVPEDIHFETLPNFKSDETFPKTDEVNDQNKNQFLNTDEFYEFYNPRETTTVFVAENADVRNIPADIILGILGSGFENQTGVSEADTEVFDETTTETSTTMESESATIERRELLIKKEEDIRRNENIQKDSFESPDFDLAESYNEIDTHEKINQVVKSDISSLIQETLDDELNDQFFENEFLSATNYETDYELIDDEIQDLLAISSSHETILSDKH